MVSALLQVSGLRVDYKGTTVVQDLSLHVNKGGLGCLLGPSGCGKTTTLRAIAGFEPVVAGAIEIAGTPVSTPGRTVAPERRRVGMVFQDNALFPHLNVEGNIAFGLRGVAAAARRERVDEMLDVVGLQGLARRYVHELSGGQQQRVALARALAPRPDVVLLDEPFSSLDADLRERLAREVRQILHERGITALLVTHDQNEAFALADHVGVMRDGRLVRLRVDIVDQPGVLAKLAEFIGACGGNIMEVHHQRLFYNVPAKQAEIDVVVETRNADHVHEIVARLRAGGFPTRVLSARSDDLAG